MQASIRSFALVAAFCAIGCATTKDDGEELIGADEDVVDTSGESVAGEVTVGSKMKATDNVNLRTGASTGYKVLHVIPKGAEVTVVSSTPKSGWYNISHGGQSGWSHGGYLDRVSSSTTPPPSGGCKGQLTALGLSWSTAGATKGIAEPVTVKSPIRGVAFRYVASSTTSPILGNCAFFVKLAAAADAMKKWDVAEFTHIGTYNYRTIAGSSKLSQHALGMAIDIAGMRTNGGTYYSVANNTHFVKNTSSSTCSQPRTTSGDKLFKGWACEAHASKIFNIILTPNYNADHRDHFHVDLTPGSNTIKAKDGTEGTPFDTDTVDPFSLEPLGDTAALDHEAHAPIPQYLLDEELRIQATFGATPASL